MAKDKHLQALVVLRGDVGLPLLTVYGDFLALLGSFVVQNIEAGMSGRLFFNRVMDSISFVDFAPGVVKTIFFGFIMGIVGCYEGYNSEGGTEGVGRSATDAVVFSSLLIIIADVLAVKLTVFFFDIS